MSLNPVEPSLEVFLPDIEPYLEHIELLLSEDSIAPFDKFTLIIKASGSELPSDGSWFQITLAGHKLPIAPKTTIISKPKGKVLSLGVKGQWRIELQAPEEEGDYWLHVIMDSVDTDQRIVKIPFTVRIIPEGGINRALINRALTSITYFGIALAVIWLAFSIDLETGDTILDSKISIPSIDYAMKAPLTSGERIEVTDAVKTQARKDSKTKLFIDRLLDQSFNDQSVLMRQDAWRKISLFVDSQGNADTPHIRKILQQRYHHKQQVESWIISNDNPQELIKRLQVLAFVDDNQKAQRWLGDLHATGRIVVKHLGKAWLWYQRAANKGDTESQQLLDELEIRADQMLHSANLEERLQAYEVAEESASAGGVNSQLWMGYRYETGDGVERDLVIAAVWYSKAAEQGNTLASEKLSKILDMIPE
ncbi:MAG: tetratricopeptide repeat protein [Methylococcales bacterium]